MKNSRAIAARIIAQVSHQGRSLSTALDATVIAGQDKALVQALCYGTLRGYFRLQQVANALLNKPLKAKDGDVYALLLLGLYQLTMMRIPDHAAVSETVAATAELKKPWARGLVNGVLRGFQRDSENFLRQAQATEEGRWMHPQWLIEKIREAWPQDWEQILAANNQHPPMTLRVNRSQTTVRDYLSELKMAGIEAKPSAQVESAICLGSPVDVTELPGFASGRVSVQDEAAQLAAELLDLQDGQRVLDVCAAPGGKTGHILETAAVDLVAVDVDAGRLQRVDENLRRLGQPAQLLVGDAAKVDTWWGGELFDRILLDVPCSATGVIRRHPDIKLLRRSSDIVSLVALQAEILDSVWTLLKPGGILLYATCSVLPVENTQQLSAFTARQKDAICREIALPYGKQQAIGRQILPGEGKVGDEPGGMDGFYYACLEKQAFTG